jgi:hypothetical protein
MKSKQRSLIVVELADLEKEIEQVYSFRHYNLAYEITSPNDVCYLYEDIDGVIKPEEAAYLTDFVASGHIEGYTLDVVLNDLVVRGRITPGDYLIKFIW